MHNHSNSLMTHSLGTSSLATDKLDALVDSLIYQCLATSSAPHSQVEEALALAWNRGAEVTVCVVPAMQARVLTRPTVGDEGEEVFCDDDDDDSDDEDDVGNSNHSVGGGKQGEFSRRVVGIIRIPNLEERPVKKAGRSSALGRFLFRSGEGSGGTSTGGGQDTMGLTAQTARAYIIERTIRMLNEAGADSPATPPIETWLRRVQPVLVKEFGETLVDANSEFLLELLSNYSSSTATVPATSSLPTAGHTATVGGRTSRGASWSGDREEALGSSGGGAAGVGGGGAAGGNGTSSSVRHFPTGADGIVVSADADAQDDGDGQAEAASSA
jgi:hypothetical protein